MRRKNSRNGESDPADLLTARQGAVIVGVTGPTLVSCHLRGQLPARFIGGMYLFERHELEAFKARYKRGKGRRPWKSNAESIAESNGAPQLERGAERVPA